MGCWFDCNRTSCQALRGWWGAAVALALSICVGAEALGAEKRLALVIGNARYREIPLNNPENDARVIASTLRRLGFEVSEHVNLNVKDFRRVLREFARRLQNEEGAAVLFYAGHGVQIDGRNYLLPVDINLRDQEEVKDEAVDIEELFISRLERSRTGVRIVILDACRDNPFKGRTRNISVRGGGLAEMNAAGALIAYSAAPGSTAEDGPPGTNSVFTRHLAKEMLVEGVEVEQMFKNVRVKVIRDTGHRQVPWVNTSMTVNFMFNPRRGPTPEDAAKQAHLARLQELLERREQEQRRLEEQVRRLQQTLQSLRPAIPEGSTRDAIPARPSAAQMELALVAPRIESVATAPSSASPANTPAGSPADAQDAGARAGSTSAVRPSPAHIELAVKPTRREERVQRPEKPTETMAMVEMPTKGHDKTTAAHPLPKAQSERCVAVLIRAQLGEALSQDDLNHLKKECR
ncbi:MAG: caspase family protein [Burkholderiaceae bacterium]|nr:caspase family protein [Burkholderiaceae bacterium]